MHPNGLLGVAGKSLSDTFARYWIVPGGDLGLPIGVFFSVPNNGFFVNSTFLFGSTFHVAQYKVTLTL